MDNYLVSEITHYCNISVKRCSALSLRQFKFFDLTFVLSGAMTYEVDGKTYVLEENDAVFIPPNTPRKRLSGNTPVKYVSFNFLLLDGKELSFPTHMKSVVTSDIRRLISAFPQQHLSPYYHSHQKVANILNYILFELQDVVLLPSSNEHTLKIIKYIGEHITERLSLADISQTIGLCKEHVSFLFKREMGTTLTKYVNRQKMLAAKELILSREMNLNEVARFLGYDNYCYFSRLFKQTFDMTPIQMQQSHR